MLVRATVLLAAAALYLAVPDAGVEIKAFQFQPSPVRIAAGDSVRWINRDAIEHTVTSGAPGQPDGGFDARLEEAGQAVTLRFPAAGRFPYYCDRHRFMTGEIVVTPTPSSDRSK